MTCHPGGDSDRLLPVNLLSRRSTFPPSKNWLFQFPAPTSGTVFHHTLHAHRRSRYSGSVSRHFSSTCHIRIWFSDFPPTSLWTLRCYLGHIKNLVDVDDHSRCKSLVTYMFLHFRFFSDFKKHDFLRFLKCRGRELNPRPPDHESNTLATNHWATNSPIITR